MSISKSKIVFISSMVVSVCLLSLYFMQVARLTESSYLLSANQLELKELVKQNLASNNQTNKINLLSIAEQNIVEYGFVKVSDVKFIPLANDYLVKSD